ncbi:MAG: peptide ABC transporter substrate-binding protein [Woeseiaceae bacterium]|nr:peptide ABC transporter substrate-binding protein [Woeseiaceae bacterium]
MRRTFVLRVLALSVAGLLLAGCGGGEDTGNTLHRAVGPEPESLDPHHSRTAQAQSVQRDLFEGLVAFSPSGDLVPGVAERWQLSDDGRRYTFELRRDARWSNGDAVTASDFVSSFRRLVDPATASFYAESLIDITNAQAIVNGTMPPDTLTVSAPGPHRLEIELERPVPYFLSLLAKPSAFPVHPPSVALHGDSFARAGRLVSNGAYKLDDWQLGAVIDISRNEHYWNNAETAIDHVRHHVTVEPAAELFRYRAGELHITSTVPVEAYEQVARERPDELRVAPQLGTYFYGLNLSREPFRDNPALRRALTMAIDRDVLAEKVIGRGELPAYSWVPPGTLDYEPPRMAFADLPADERIAEARRHYREAGYSDDNPVSVELRYNTSDTHQRIALAVQSMWRDALGFEATLINEEFQVLVANMRAMEITEAFRLSWLGDYNDAYSFLSVFESDNPSNMYGYSSDRYDALLAEAAMQLDPDRRRDYLQQAEQLLLDDNPVIPLYFHVSKHLVSPRVAGWRDNVLDFHYSQHLSLR